jgi:thiamine biosynthesis lipoprotein
MGITLDGIAKGFIVDAMAATLEAYGVDRFLIDAGGDIRASGLREDDVGWTVAVRDPYGQGMLDRPVRLERGAIATSGAYEAWFDPDGSWHHIVSTRTGRSPSDVLSVTVAGPDTLTADALATAVCLERPDAGVRLIDSLAGFECLVIEAGGRIRTSGGWDHLTSHPDRKGVR